MIKSAFRLGLTPVVTLRHFTLPQWFAAEGGWLSPAATETFASYVSVATSILDDVEWVITINEPNIMALMVMIQKAARSGQLGQWQAPPLMVSQSGNG